MWGLQFEIEDTLKKCGFPLSWTRKFLLAVLVKNSRKEFKALEKEIYRVTQRCDILRDTVGGLQREIAEAKKRQSNADKLYDAVEILMDMRR